jgi:hypothetical protein
MKARGIIFPLLMGGASMVAQTPVPLISTYGHLVVFQEGRFQDVEPRKPQAVFQSGDRLAYLTEAGDLKLFTNGKVTVQENGGTEHVAASHHMLAWTSGPSLRIPGPEKGHIICRSVGRFTVGDSLIVFEDGMNQTLSVYWNGRVIPVADVLMTNGAVQWKNGTNTVLVYDEGGDRVLFFHHGTTTVLCEGSDPARSAPGGDMVAYMDKYDDTFHVFDHGETYDLDAFAPKSFQVGDGLVAYVSRTDELRCFQGGRSWTVLDHAPDEYWVKDSLLVFRDMDEFKVFDSDAVETLARTMPDQWQVSGSMVAWLDVNGVLQAFRDGQRIVVSKEPGIAGFDLYPGTVVFRSRSGASKVWWNGRLYEHY